MTLDAHSGLPRSVARLSEADLPDALAAEAIELVDAAESPLHFAPTRGILNAVGIGAGAWIVLLGAFALARALFFG